ncbi:DNA-binding capsular synthesis response regulator RcsB [Salmonella enterica subsp. enterica serovar Johannesburg str. S5-703]|nr:DNA-binding capsular synthesis response regulator RcsB [Salmonella enterica subsp. enterica serovar Johannesburg str. S5-703]
MNVIIADDHPIVLFGIRKSLEQIEWVNVVGEFEDSTALINNLPKLDAHVLITDLSMPGDKYGDGITLIKYIKRHFPSLSIIVLTMNNNPAILSAVLDLDIEGIVLKQGAPTDLPKALAALQKGKKFTPESVSRLLEKISAGGYGDKRLRTAVFSRFRQAPVAKRERSITPVRRGLPGHRNRQEAQPQH